MPRPRRIPRKSNDTRQDVSGLKRRIEISKPDYKTIKEEIQDYFADCARRRQVVATTRTPSGQTLDWVPIESQIKRGKIAEPPPKLESFIIDRHKLKDQVVRFELEDSNVERGPKGTVPKITEGPFEAEIHKAFEGFFIQAWTQIVPLDPRQGR